MRERPIEERLASVTEPYFAGWASEGAERIGQLKRQRAMLWRMLRAQRAKSRSLGLLLEREEPASVGMSPAVCRAMAHFWTKLAERREREG